MWCNKFWLWLFVIVPEPATEDPQDVGNRTSDADVRLSTGSDSNLDFLDGVTPFSIVDQNSPRRSQEQQVPTIVTSDHNDQGFHRAAEKAITPTRRYFDSADYTMTGDESPFFPDTLRNSSARSSQSSEPRESSRPSSPSPLPTVSSKPFAGQAVNNGPTTAATDVDVLALLAATEPAQPAQARAAQLPKVQATPQTQVQTTPQPQPQPQPAAQTKAAVVEEPRASYTNLSERTSDDDDIVVSPMHGQVGPVVSQPHGGAYMDQPSANDPSRHGDSAYEGIQGRATVVEEDCCWCLPAWCNCCVKTSYYHKTTSTSSTSSHYQQF